MRTRQKSSSNASLRTTFQEEKEEEIKCALAAETVDEIEAYFETKEWNDHNINTYRFTDGESIFIYACSNHYKAAKVLLDRFDIDITVKSIDGLSALGTLIMRKRIASKLCRTLLDKMLQQKRPVSKDDLKLANDFCIQANGNKVNKEVTELYNNMKEHNEKLINTRPTTIQPASKPVSTLAVKDILDLTTKDPDFAEIKKLEEELKAKLEARNNKIEQAKNLKRKLEQTFPMFEKFKNDREKLKKAKETYDNSGRDLIAARNALLTYLDADNIDILDVADKYNLEVPNLKNTVSRFLLESNIFQIQPSAAPSPITSQTVTTVPLLPQFTTVVSEGIPRPNSSISEYSYGDLLSEPENPILIPRLPSPSKQL